MVVGEVCGDCIDNDEDGLTDFEDPACCGDVQTFPMMLAQGRFKPRGADRTYMWIKSRLASADLGKRINPRKQKVYVQIRDPEQGEIFCAWVNPSSFFKECNTYLYIASNRISPNARGITDLRLKIAKNGRVFMRLLARKGWFVMPEPPFVQLTIGFQNTTGNDADNSCSAAIEAFTSGKNGALRYP